MEEHRDGEHFVYLTHCAGIEFFKAVRKGMQDAASLLDVEVSFGGTDDFDLEEQLSLLNKAIDRGAAGIATSIIDPDAFREPVARALDSGIPVVVFNTDASDGKAGQLATVAQDTYAAGRKLGRYIAENNTSTGTVLITYHSDQAAPLLARGRGIREALDAGGRTIETLVTGNGADVSLATLKEYLHGRTDIAVIAGTGQDDTEAIGTYISETGAGISAYGFDFNCTIQQHLEEKNLLAVIDQQPYAQGFYPLLFMWLYRHRGILPSDLNPGMKLHTAADLHTGI